MASKVHYLCLEPTRNAFLYFFYAVPGSSHVSATPNRVAPLLDSTIFCPGTGYSVLIFFGLTLSYLLMHWSQATLFAYSCGPEHFIASLHRAAQGAACFGY